MSEPVLLEVTRGGRVESRHRGAVVLLDADGRVAVALGDPDQVVFARSALKPLQAAAMVRLGWPGSLPSIALAAASHDGAPAHLTVARETLRAAGLTEAALGCPPDLPLDRDALVAWVGAGGGPAAVCHNCSGKHAAMVATCAARDWPVAGYLDPAHPLQQAVRDEIERACAAPVAASSVDGCGAPAHALPLVALARGFAALGAASEADPLGRVAGAMRSRPDLVGGERRAVTQLMAGVPGLVAKDGAEGVVAAALPDGRAFAAKVADGAGRALGPLLAAAAASWGASGEAVARWSAMPVLGGGRPVGAVGWSADLRAALHV